MEMIQAIRNKESWTDKLSSMYTLHILSTNKIDKLKYVRTISDLFCFISHVRYNQEH